MSRDGWKVISIHRSLAGPDLLRLAHFHVLGISIHRSLAGPDSGHTPPGCRTSDFNPQVPCGTRRRNGKDRQTRPYFNPQVPCGTRLSCRRTTSRTPRFQSTGPLRDPTVPGAARGHPDHISIHRSLAGPDMDYSLQHTYRLRFQSTGPLRDPTRAPGIYDQLIRISIHRSLAGPDRDRQDTAVLDFEFQSTGPLRDPTPTQGHLYLYYLFQSTGPLRDPTACPVACDTMLFNFNPQVPCGTRLYVISIIILPK